METQKDENGSVKIAYQPTFVTPETNKAAMPSLNIGSVISRTFGLLGKKPLIFFGLTLLAALPSFLLTIGIEASETQRAALLPKILEMILGTAMQGATAYAVYQLLRGSTVSFGESVVRGMARLLPLIGASILIGLATALGFAFFIIPGLILLCLWYVTIPVCVVEKLGPLDSMTRSAKLTSGYRWPIFGLVVVVFLATALLYIAVVSVAAFGNVFVFAALLLVVFIIPQAFGNAMVAVVYFDLRAIKEGITIDSLVNVFD